MSWSRIAVPLLLAVFTASCAPQAQRTYIAPRYEPTLFGYAAGGRDLQVEVIGNPTPLARADFAQKVVDAMQGQKFGQQTNLTLTPGPSARPRYRAVLAFNPVDPVGAFDLCRGEAPATMPAGDQPLQVRAAFCEGTGTLTSVRGEAPADTSVDDPAFRTLMASVTRQLLPQRNPEGFRDDERPCVWPRCD